MKQYDMKEYISFLKMGIQLPDPTRSTIILMPIVSRMDSTYRYWRLREKLYEKNRKLNKWLQWTLLPLALIGCLLLLIPLAILISMYIPEIGFGFGLMYGVLTLILMIYLNEVIRDLRIITNHYYKHRKSKN